MHRSRFGSLVLCATLILTQTGCGLTRAALVQERSRLQLELDALKKLESDISAGTFPGGQRHIQLKIGYDLINQILAGADNVSAPLPESSDAFIHINEIRLDGHSSTPLLRVSAKASKYNVKIDVTVTAMLVLEQDDPAKPPLFRVRIQDIAPVFTWRNFSLRRMELARKVMVTRADELALNAIKFPIPIEHAVQLDIPKIEQSADVPTRSNGSWIRYRISKPPSSLDRILKVDRVAFLSDGIYVFATIS